MTPRPRRRIALLVEYDGTRYWGWQRQERHATVQAEIEVACSQLLGESVSLFVAGRTDKGVHALGQVAHADIDAEVPVHRLTKGLNFFLPDDIRIHDTRDVPQTFDARIDSSSKVYRYRVLRGPHLAPNERHHAWHLRARLDVLAMRDAAERLVGHFDFESCRSAHCDAAHAVREIYSIDVNSGARTARDELITFTLHANAFCRHMCRIIVGTLIDVGRGKRRPEDIGPILAARSRAAAGMTAPGHGLTLLEVRYPSNLDPFAGKQPVVTRKRPTT